MGKARKAATARGRMRLGKKALLALLFICLLLLFNDLGEDQALVVDVIDGDTIVALTHGQKETIRYLLIDTPELHHPHRGKEELGEEAKAFNASLVLNNKIRIELDKQERDKYDRLLAYVWVNTSGGEKMVNEALVEEGLALPYVIPPNGKYLNIVMEATRRARSKNVGLWKRAQSRIFTPDQIYSELPYLTGSFVTIKIKIDKIEKSGSRWILSQGKSKCRLVIYDNNKYLTSIKDSLIGKEVKVVGKVTASYGGAEIAISDPAQIISEGLPLGE